MTSFAGNISPNVPLSGYQFQVRIGMETHSFSEVTGLNLSHEPVIYRHGLSLHEGAVYLPGIPQPIQVSLRRGVVAHRSLLFEWMQSIRNSTAKKLDITVALCDEKGVPIISWIVMNALPIQLNAPEFRADASEIAVEQLDLMGSDLRVDYHKK